MIRIIENQIRLLKERFDGEEGNMNEMDIHHLERLEQQVRLLQRRRRSIEQSARSFVNRLVLICRPFQFIVGSILALFGFLIFLSLLLTSIDKAINSLGKHIREAENSSPLISTIICNIMNLSTRMMKKPQLTILYLILKGPSQDTSYKTELCLIPLTFY